MTAAQVIVQGADRLIRSYANAKRDIRDRQKQKLGARLATGVAHIQKTYRKFSRDDRPTLAGTRLITGNLYNSYHHQESIQGSEVIGEMGLFRSHARGNALVYGRLWELGGVRTWTQVYGRRLRTPVTRHLAARPLGGALNLEAARLTPYITKDMADAVAEWSRANG